MANATEVRASARELGVGGGVISTKAIAPTSSNRLQTVILTNGQLEQYNTTRLALKR